MARPHPPTTPHPAPRRARGWWAAAAHLTLVACTGGDPVLVALPDPGEAQGPSVTPNSSGPAAYARPAGVYIDAPYLLRTRVIDGRDVIIDQLGALIETRELPAGQGQELRMERGALRVIDQRVYMVRAPLPEALRRIDVFPSLGLPPPVGEPIQTHRDYRYHNERGTRLIRLARQAPDNELVTEVEVWDMIPGEHGNRRR